MTSREDKSYAKWVVDDVGHRSKRYHATDPADDAIVCTCGKEQYPRGRLLPFRLHIAEVHRVLSLLHEEELAFLDPAPWACVLYALRMAASIDDVEADTGFVVDTMVFALCEVTIDYEDGQSEMASKYVAAATVFNFLWQAYEAAVSETAPDELRRLAKETRFGERGRRLLEARPGLTARLHGTTDLVKLALWHCRTGGLMDERCERVVAKYGDSCLVAAAELAREFRNFLFHGGDEAPGHEDWSWDGRQAGRCRIHRFYSIGRLVLYLIHAMALIAHEADVDPIEYGSEDDEMTPCEVLERLQFKGPGVWPPLRQRPPHDAGES